jgi:hypothetical protein
MRCINCRVLATTDEYQNSRYPFRFDWLDGRMHGNGPSTQRLAGNYLSSILDHLGLNCLGPD